jgi:hypothetical protein
MSAKIDPDESDATETERRTCSEAVTGADHRPKAAPQLATLDIVAGGETAVTRLSVPPVFRFLLALTGVRV